MVGSRPDLYEACIGLVRSTVEYLERVPDVDALVTTYLNSAPEPELTEVGVDLTTIPSEIRLELVRDAAYQMRSRQLAQREAVERTRDRIRRARARLEPVATIWTEGDNELWPPYRRIDMSLRTGNAVAVSTSLSPETMTPVFSLEGVVLDPETGEGTGEPPLAPEREYTDPDEWRSAAEALRRDLLSQ